MWAKATTYFTCYNTCNPGKLYSKSSTKENTTKLGSHQSVEFRIGKCPGASPGDYPTPDERNRMYADEEILKYIKAI